MSFANEKEVKVFQSMVAEIIHGDPEKKKMIDRITAYAISGFKELLPNATDEELAKVLMSFAITMLRINTLPLNTASTFVGTAFEGYVASVAILVGAYEPDPDNIPDKATDESIVNQFVPGYTDEEWENILGKAYL